jgi:hypothetical protein
MDAAERLFRETGIDLEQVQIVGVEGDPDVEALSRQRIAAIKQQAKGFLDSRSYAPVPFVSRLPLPVPIIMACDFCGEPTLYHAMRWKLVRYVARPLGGSACRACYPLDREALNKVYAARVKRQAA